MFLKLYAKFCSLESKYNINIPVYDVASKDELETWLDQIEIACQIAGREQDI